MFNAHTGGKMDIGKIIKVIENEPAQEPLPGVSVPEREPVLVPAHTE